MAEDQVGPDLSQGLSIAELPDGGKLVGHVGDEPVLLARQGSEAFAVGAHCTHYHGPLVDGLIVDGEVRCPWHHACFDLRTGEALRAPAFSPLDTWTVEQRDGKLFVREKRARRSAKPRSASAGPKQIVIVGGGAAGFAAAEMLRRQKYDGEIVMFSSDDAPPVDRPSLSKDYLAGSAPEEWVPLSPMSFYSDNAIELRLRTTVTGVNVAGREVALANGERIPFDRLLLATGAEPVQPSVPGAKPSDVLVLRSLRRLPSDHRTGQDGATGRGARGELHRARGRSFVTGAKYRGPCRGAGTAPDGAHSGLRIRRLHSCSP